MINLKDPIYLSGSCFSDEIGELFVRSKFNTLSNPFGTIYNPHSIFNTLTANIRKEDVIENNGVFYHWSTHGEVSGLSKEEVVNKLMERLDKSQGHLAKSKWLIITFGTSWVYRYNKTNEVVANCHKIPNTSFDKELLPTDTIVEKFLQAKKALDQFNPEINIILTVSPVRHAKDGLAENNRSKAQLIEAAHQITAQFDRVSYFPSYEIVIDELRDYRFFKEDMVHPSSQAINYVWKRFADTYFDEETSQFMEDWNKVLSALNHTPLLATSTQHQKFLQATLKNLERLNDMVDVSVEIKQIKTQLT